MTDAMTQYYALRASEYERIYEKPERQQELSVLRQTIESCFGGTDVLEVACGTGYWTRFAAAQARSILATDINREVLDIARSKDFMKCDVTFLEADAHHLPEWSGRFSAALCAFWLSHVRRNQIRSFLANLHAGLKSGAQVVLIDNVFAEGSSTPVSRTDAGGNTFQHRTLSNGKTFEVLKNFFDAEGLRDLVRGISREVQIDVFRYYWIVRYRVL